MEHNLLPVKSHGQIAGDPPFAKSTLRVSHFPMGLLLRRTLVAPPGDRGRELQLSEAAYGLQRCAPGGKVDTLRSNATPICCA